MYDWKYEPANNISVYAVPKKHSSDIYEAFASELLENLKEMFPRYL